MATLRTTKKTAEKIAKLFNEEGISFHADTIEEGTELETWTELGENMIIVVQGATKEEGCLPTLAQALCKTFNEEYENFDVDEHVGMLLEVKRNGVSGIPSARALVKDAEEYEEWLEKVADKLCEIVREEEEERR